MFEHLDGPTPFIPDEPFRRSVYRHGRRRMVRRRVALGGAALTMVIIAMVGAVGVVAQDRVNQVERLDIAGDVLETPTDDAVVNVLLVGSDHEAGLLEGTQTDTAQADLIMVLRLDRRTGTARVLSVPRDLWVATAGPGGGNKINATLQQGAGALVETVEQTLGVPVHHYVQFEFSGFARLVDQLGGVALYLDTPLRDPTLGLLLESTGCVDIDGETALALVRSRRLEYLDHGTWITDQTGDIGRITRQQFIAGTLAAAVTELDLTDLFSVVDLAVADVAIDQAFTTGELREWARWALEIDAGDIAFATLDTEPGIRADGATALFAEPEQLDQASDWLDGRTPAAPAPTGYMPDQPRYIPEQPSGQGCT